MNTLTDLPNWTNLVKNDNINIDFVVGSEYHHYTQRRILTMKKTMMVLSFGTMLSITILGGYKINVLTNDIALEKKQNAVLIGEAASMQRKIDKLAESIVEKDGRITELGVIIDSKSATIIDLRAENGKFEEEVANLNNKIKSLSSTPSYTGGSVTFNASNVTMKSNITTEQMRKALEGTNLEGLAETYVQAEATYGVNAVFLAALNAWESEWGKSGMAMSKNNLGGVKSRSGGYRSFDSRSECVNEIAALLSESYLKPGAKWYNGTSVQSISIMYNLGEQSWVDGITQVANSLKEKAIR